MTLIQWLKGFEEVRLILSTGNNWYWRHILYVAAYKDGNCYDLSVGFNNCKELDLARLCADLLRSGHPLRQP